MEPRYLTSVVAANLLLCGVANRGSSGRSVTIGGWHTRVSSYLFLQRYPGLVLAEIRLGSRVIYSRDVPIVDRKFLSLTICWKSKLQYVICTVLVVEPAIHLWWRPTVWMVAIVGIRYWSYVG